MAIKCLVLGCTNQSDQGTMAGPICMPCDGMLRYGRPRLGDDWVSKLARRNIELCDGLRNAERAISVALRCEG